MFKNKWINAAIPALLIHCSIGTVYCWSTFKEAIAQTIGMSTFAVGWAIAGLTGNNLSEIILSNTNNYNTIILVASGLYLVALVVCLSLVRHKQ